MRKYSQDKPTQVHGRRIKRKVPVGKTLPGAEAVWSKQDSKLNYNHTKPSELSTVGKTLWQMERARVDISRKFPTRRQHRSDMKPYSPLAYHDSVYNQMLGGKRNIGEVRKNTNTDFGPGHSIAGSTDASKRTKYKDRLIIKSTQYGNKLMRSSFDKKRK